MLARLWFVVTVLWVGLLAYMLATEPELRFSQVLPWMIAPFILRLLVRWIVAGRKIHYRWPEKPD